MTVGAYGGMRLPFPLHHFTLEDNTVQHTRKTAKDSTGQFKTFAELSRQSARTVLQLGKLLAAQGRTLESYEGN